MIYPENQMVNVNGGLSAAVSSKPVAIPLSAQLADQRQSLEVFAKYAMEQIERLTARVCLLEEKVG